MGINDMLIAYLDHINGEGSYNINGYEISGAFVVIHFDFPCSMGRKAGETEVELLDILAFVWESKP